MAKLKAIAHNFGDDGSVKEFITPDGKTYLVIKFQDYSVAVLQRFKGSGNKGAVTKYTSVTGSQRGILMKLGAKGKTTYEMGAYLLK